jgi:disulfide bond formation protein DsbB
VAQSEEPRMQAWRFLGISLAGYNALISLALAAVALAGRRRAR